MEGFAILVLTMPLLQPILEPLGLDMIWFVAMMVIVLEMGLISPPVGVNVFVVKGIAEGVPLNTIFRGIWPFWFAMLACIVLLITVSKNSDYSAQQHDQLMLAKSLIENRGHSQSGTDSATQRQRNWLLSVRIRCFILQSCLHALLFVISGCPVVWLFPD